MNQEARDITNEIMALQANRGIRMANRKTKIATLNKKVPAFQCVATPDQIIKFSNLQGKKVVLYFYPKDNTPGCTTEGQDFRDQHTKFKRAGTVIFGISRDSLKSHQNFKEKHKFQFELISDPDEKLCKLFDVIKMKNMYGKKARGIERSTFVINDKGVLKHEWRKVKVKGHVEEVLATVKSL